MGVIIALFVAVLTCILTVSAGGVFAVEGAGHPISSFSPTEFCAPNCPTVQSRNVLVSDVTAAGFDSTPIGDLNAFGGGSFIQGNSANVRGLAVVPRSLPQNTGCYAGNEGTWESVPCVPSSDPYVAPTEGGTSGVEGIGAGTDDGYPLIVTELVVSFSEFTSEKDNESGNNVWSIQETTNTWIGSNGDTYVVQFTEQNYPSNDQPSAEVCVWQIDVTTQNYKDHKCVSTIHQAFSTSPNGFTVEGVVTSTDSLSALYMGPGGSEWNVAMSDSYGLRSNWEYTSGTVLGLGGGSEAIFANPVAESTLIEVGYVHVPSDASYSLSYLTDETNNMIQGTPSDFNCILYSGDPGDICQLTTPST
jgi:hypothetical protein